MRWVLRTHRRVGRMTLFECVITGVALGMLGWMLLHHLQAWGGAARPLRFATPLEAQYFDQLLACEGRLDGAERYLRAERAKTATAVASCAVTCPTIPPCPDTARPAWLDVTTHVGVAIGGAALGRLSCGGDPSTVVVR